MAGLRFFSPICYLLFLSGSSTGIQVTVNNPFNVVILFQPVTLQCNYVTSSLQPPIVQWKYKSFCRDRIADAFNPTGQDTQINAQLQQNNPGYNPYVECQDSARTVRMVATKQGNTVTLGDHYQGRQITITNNADLSIDRTLWGDSGVYYCSVISSQDLTGNNEAYAELLVLVYEAGKAATSGIPSIYAPSVYAPSVYSHPSQVKIPPPGSMIAMGPVQPMYNGYGMDFDAASSVGGHSSQAPLIRDNDVANSVRSGYRIQANQQDDSMRVLYYMEKELANFDPSRPGDPNTRYDKSSAMSEVSSLHEEDHRNNLRSGLGRLRNQAMTPIRDIEEESLLGSDIRRTQPSRQDPYAEDRFRGGPVIDRRARSHSVDDLDDFDRRDRYPYREPQYDGRSRGRRNSDDESSSRGYSRSRQGHSPEPPSYGGKRSRSRDDLRDMDRSRNDPEYDDRFLEDVLRRKQQRAGSRDGLESIGHSAPRSDVRRNRNDDDFPPPPPPYTETESVSSRGKKIKKSEALSRDSLVV
ncbi:lipolysis-stimulated lipoprotein receptor isoform X3 [Bombina bombina]|uniref:lipolysis-stimulated lipoprotein receptor isoform X3 n=1 Tax=Bombina bombina TaxID=8345 RepID=UPI00235A4EBF|nr:lipolysis-stimulated lipoprotein receptor isoform X3 [Bombina bombina]